MNLIVVTAGNYKTKTEDDGGGVVDHQARAQAARRAVLQPRSGSQTARRRPALAFHPEDDPMEKHDHPTSRQRLGDIEAGLGAAATLTPADAEAIRSLRGVQYVVRRAFTRTCTPTPATSAGSRGCTAATSSCRRSAASWTFTARPLLHRARAVARARRSSCSAPFAAAEAVRRRQPGRPADVCSGSSRSRSSASSRSGSWMVAPAAGRRSVRRGLRAVHAPIHRLLNLSKLNDITITAASTGEVTRVSKDVTELLRARHGIGDEGSGRLHRRDAGAAVAGAAAACGPTSRAPSSATSAASRR